MSKTDIPPGGEGEIKVTLHTGMYRNNLRKTVRVTSNDPEQPTTYLHVEAFIKVEAGFETSSLSVDNVLADARTVKETYIELRGFKGVEVDSITSSNDLIKARVVEPPGAPGSEQRLKVEVVLEPGLKPGLLSETVTVYFKNDERPESQLYLYGIVVRAVEVTPLALVYVIDDSTPNDQNLVQTLTVKSHDENSPLEIVNVSDPADMLEYDVIEVEPKKVFDIKVKLSPIELTPGAALASDVVITTNHPGRKEIQIPVRVERK